MQDSRGLIMADANQLKIRARREEAAGEYEQASQLYLEALAAMDEGGNLSDPSLLVRVADLEYRQGEEASALEYYLEAVDEYAEQGLITNAIAVCNKILRVFPDRVECHRRLADLHMDVGLTAEARQNLLRYADEAWDPQTPDPVLDAMRSFLRRTPDQEVALRLASRLQELDRSQEAMDTLEAVWRERTRAGADVQALKRKAEAIHSDAQVEEWSLDEEDDEPEAGAGPGEDDAADREDEDLGAGGAFEPEPRDVGQPAAEAGSGGPGGRWSGDSGDSGGGEDADGDADDWTGGFPGRSEDADPGGTVPAGTAPADNGDRELELVASYLERFTPYRDALPAEEAAPHEGASPDAGTAGPGATGDEEASSPWSDDGEDDAPSAGSAVSSPDNGAAPPGAGDPAPPAEEREETDPFAGATDAPVEEDALPGETDVPAPETETGPPLETESGGTQESAQTDHERPAGAEQPPADGADDDDDVAQREERIMEELNELDRANDVATAESDGWGDDVAEGDRPSNSRDDVPPEPPETSAGDELGEEAELRRGLDLVDEMLEVQPDNLELRERKVRYARRLGDRDVLVGACLELAEALAKEDARRGARALYRRVLELDPENQAAESGLARLDVGELEEKRQSGKRAGAAHSTPEAATPEEQEARRELGMRLWTEFENSIREMPWLHAATQAYQSTGPDALPPLEAFEMLAHYLMARERYGDAAEILERALKLTGDEDEAQVADLLYDLGQAYERMGEDRRADEYYGRLEDLDPAFARVRSALPDPDEA